MAAPLALTPYGGTVARPDGGGYLFLPTDMLDQAAPVDAPALDQQPPPPPGQSGPELGAPLAPPRFEAPGIVDPFAAEEADPAGGEQPGEAPSHAEPPGQPAPPPADPAALPPDAVTGVAPSAAPAPAPAPVANGAVPDAARVNPWEQAAQLQEGRADILASAQQGEDRIRQAQDAEVARVQRAQAAERQQHEQRIARASEEHRLAAADLTRFENAQPETPWSRKIGSLIAIALGGIGATLSGQPGQNPVLAILDAKAKERAAERARRWQQLRGRSLDTLDGVDRAIASAKSADEAAAAALGQTKLYFAGLMEQHARRVANVTDQQNALLEAAKQRQEADKFFTDAGQKAAAHDLQVAQHYASVAQRDAQLRIDAANAETSRYNAGTQRMGAIETNRHNLVTENQRAVELTLKGDENQINGALLRFQKQAWQDARAERSGAIPVVERHVNPDGSVTLRQSFRQLMQAPAPAVDDMGRPVDAQGRLVGSPGAGPQAIAAQPWRAPDTPTATKLRAQHADAEFIAGEARQLAAKMRAEGWTADTLKTDAGREMLQRFHEILLTRKENLDHLGVLTGPDVGVEAQVILGDKAADPTTWGRLGNPADAVDRMVQTLEDKLNAKYRLEGQYTGERITLSAVSGDRDATGVNAKELGQLGGNYTEGDFYPGTGTQDWKPIPARQVDVVGTNLLIAAPDSTAQPDAKRAALDRLIVMAGDGNIGPAVTWMIATQSDLNFNGPVAGATSPTPSTYSPELQARIEAIRALSPEARMAIGRQLRFEGPDSYAGLSGPLTAQARAQVGAPPAGSPPVQVTSPVDQPGLRSTIDRIRGLPPQK